MFFNLLMKQLYHIYINASIRHTVPLLKPEARYNPSYENAKLLTEPIRSRCINLISNI